MSSPVGAVQLIDRVYVVRIVGDISRADFTSTRAMPFHISICTCLGCPLKASITIVVLEAERVHAVALRYGISCRGRSCCSLTGGWLGRLTGGSHCRCWRWRWSWWSTLSSEDDNIVNCNITPPATRVLEDDRDDSALARERTQIYRSRLPLLTAFCSCLLRIPHFSGATRCSNFHLEFAKSTESARGIHVV